MRYTIILAVLLAACGSAAAPTSAPSDPQVGVTLAATRFPTLTRPATSTTIPTGTPLPTITPYQTPTRAATPTFAPSWTPAPQPTATNRPPPSLLIQAPPPTAIPAPAPQPAGQSNAGKALPISKDDCPASHPIKGNQGSRSTDTWIYHMPGGSSYAATDPEECFSTEAAAQAAGYRKAVR